MPVEVVRPDGSTIRGQVQFIGKTHFHPGKWVGVTLATPSGKNNGTVLGKSYFKCAAKHGLFVRKTQVRTLPSKAPPKVTSKVRSQLQYPCTP